MVEIFCSGEERELWEDVLTARGETAQHELMKGDRSESRVTEEAEELLVIFVNTATVPRKETNRGWGTKVGSSRRGRNRNEKIHRG